MNKIEVITIKFLKKEFSIRIIIVRDMNKPAHQY